MAEQEACANAVTEALGCAATETRRGEGDGVDAELRGESLLLPLLQGLLGSGGAKLAAGLGAAPPDVAADVRRALGRLRAALRPPGAHPSATALLALADRLEDALQAADADRLDGVRRRPRRRSRTARHTVGVTRGELDEARRLVDDLTLPRDNSSSNASTGSRGTDPPTPDPTVVYHAPVEVRSKPAPVVHSISYEDQRTPEDRHEEPLVELRAPPPRRPDYFRHSVADAPPPPQHPTMVSSRPAEPSRSIAAMANRFDVNAQIERRQPSAPRRALGSPARQSSREEMNRTFFRPLPPTYNFAAPPSADDSKPAPRDRASRKLRMKRANTIDIGRSLAAHDSDEEKRAPIVPDFRPQTENDKKFVAFMRKNENGSERGGEHGHANWSSRFGNIKHAFENRENERDEIPGSRRSSSASSAARRFWHAAEESGPGHAPAPRTRSFYPESRPDAIKPPWVTERRDPPHPAPAPHPPRLRNLHPPAPAPALAPLPTQAPVLPPLRIQTSTPAPPTPSPPVPQSPTRHLGVKQFVARPIPVNQFSHAPMSAFKPPTKVASPTIAPLVWSPPSTTAVSPAAERPPAFPPSPHPLSPPPPPRAPTHAHFPPPVHDYPVTTIPTVNGLAAPELVRCVEETPHLDAQRLQIEFYERQIREKRRREAERCKLPPPPAYTVTDYTPPAAVSTFVPLQLTPDIEKARAHKVDYLPDVVTNEAELPRSPAAPPSPRSPRPADLPPAYRNGDVLTNGHGLANGHGEGAERTTAHEVAVTRVMRGPVRGAATITAGARSRGERDAADALRGALLPRTADHSSTPRRKPQAPQVRALGRSPPSLGASRESVLSSESTPSAGSGLSRSGSWHQLPARPAGSPRRLAVRTKSMHLLAVPKMFEGGIARDEVGDKKRTVEAYFSGAGGRSPPRTATRAGPAPLGRSRTVATLSELQFLDESDADMAFEDLVSALA